MKRRSFLKMGVAAGIGLAMPKRVFAMTPPPPNGDGLPYPLQHKVTVADRLAAVKNAKAMGLKPGIAGKGIDAAAVDNSLGPHYFGPYANYANSQLPTGPITAIEVVDGGSGYSIPEVLISDVYGTGTGAAATATLDNGAITAITLDNAGSGYSAPYVTITETDPAGQGSGATATATIGAGLLGGIHKFVDSLTGLNAAGQNNLGNFIPVAVPDPDRYPGPTAGTQSDYFEIAAVEFEQQFHTDLPLTRCRGYVQLETPAVQGDHYPLTYLDGSPILDPQGNQVYAVTKPYYLGPILPAKRDRPVRIKFTNYLPKGTGGELFIPVDHTVMGAGMGPMMGHFTQNRTVVHLHGGFVPWISDGTPHQWITPAGENTPYPKGVSVQNVPDMDPPGDGSVTLYYNNQQSARLMFYHDHAWGITRLNVYAGLVSGYLLSDDVEQDLINGSNVTGVNLDPPVKVLPDLGLPLIFQDKTFVDATTIAAQDPNWKWGLDGNGNPVTGSMWVPSVYMPAQNPYDPSGASAFGRWQYGPWFWPPTSDIAKGPEKNPYYEMYPWEPPMQPQMPNPSMGMEAFNDTPMINGVAYPYMEVEPRAYRFRILNGANDRFFNLHFYFADPDVVTDDGRPNTEVRMVPAISTPGFPASWPSDGREGGVPDPSMAGPSWIQIGTEGGFLPEPVVIPPQPVVWNGNMTAFNFGNISDHSLLLGPAERADVIVDFSGYAGQTLILYNDAPAAFPAPDPRYDYYTGNPDQTDSGGAPSTLPGYGPNTRTVMQVRVKAATGGVGVANVVVKNSGSDYSYSPEVVFNGGGGVDAAATAYCSLDHVTVLNSGSGYTTTNPPTVTFTNDAGDTTGANAAGTALISNGRVTGIKITHKGSGYTKAPIVTISGGDGAGATLVSALTITSISVTNSGSGYTSVPSVALSGGGGYSAAASATLIETGATYDLDTLKSVFAKSTADAKAGVFEKSQDPIIVPQAAYNSAYDTTYQDGPDTFVLLHEFTKNFYNGPLTGLQLIDGGTNYTADPTVTITGGGGTGATATAGITGAYVNGATVTNQGSGYTSAPTVTITGGTGSGATAIATVTGVVNSVTLLSGGSGYTSAPTVRFFSGSGSGAAAVATVANGRITSITMTSKGSGYFSPPSVSFVGGGGRSARAAAVLTKAVNNISITNSGSGYASSPVPTITITGGGGSGAAAVASILPGKVTSLTLDTPGSGYTSAPVVEINGGGGAGATATAIGISLPLEPKAIHDEMGAAYDIEYGRMGGLMGLELPVTNSLNQNMVLYGYSSPPVDLMQNSLTPLGTLKDGTQIWKITHNGVDTHPIHFHLFNVQLINRVAWDGALLPPEPNELGWKETVRTNPLEHTIVAMRPVAPTQPFDVPNSIRPIDPSMPIGATLAGGPSGFIDPGGTAAPVINHLVNFGWEYVWHCHILSHEEMDMMHAMSFGVAPNAPSNLAATYNNSQRRVTVTWTDNSFNETGFKVQRANTAQGPWTTLNANIPAVAGKGQKVSYTDSSVLRNRTYFYRVIATNVIGDITNYAAPAIGYPTLELESEPSDPMVGITTSATSGPGVPVTLIFASSMNIGLAGWSGAVGSVQAAPQAAVDVGPGALGLAANVGNVVALQSASDLPVSPSYVFDCSPNNELTYDASFYFNPNGAVSGEKPVDIFVGLDQNDVPVFGVQYQRDDSSAEEYQVRGWVMKGGVQTFTNMVNITNAPHLLEIAWHSDAKGGFSLFVDDNLAGTINGDTSGHELCQVLLGLCMNLSASTSGSMYFDEFTSSRINGVKAQATWFSFMPLINSNR